MTSQVHDVSKAELAQAHPRHPGTGTVPAVDHELVTTFRRDLMRARSDFRKRDIDRARHMAFVVLCARADIDHDGSVSPAQPLTQFGWG